MNYSFLDTRTTLASTAGGVLPVIINVDSGELLKTAVLATLGAVVSFTVSLILKHLYKKWVRNQS